MAVGKLELFMELTKGQKEEIRRLEAKIDDYLRAKYKGEYKENMDSPKYNGRDLKVLEAVKRLYSALGWNVGYEYSTFGGYWINFR